MPRVLLAVSVVAALAGCGTRKVAPTAMTRDGDETMTCAALVLEIKANREAAAAHFLRDKQVENANAVFVILGPSFLVDLSNEEQIKARSLVDRNDRLVLLGRSKGCIEP